MATEGSAPKWISVSMLKEVIANVESSVAENVDGGVMNKRLLCYIMAQPDNGDAQRFAAQIVFGNDPDIQPQNVRTAANRRSRPTTPLAFHHIRWGAVSMDAGVAQL
ncbi:hypothetical protein MN608_04296 [Microdochium nivale]|nr:hypothetical protein MN608_04296 [Microdochium nivale]